MNPMWGISLSIDLRDAKLSHYRMEFDAESCIIQDQFSQMEVEKFLAGVGKVSPWQDCGFTYRGKIR